MTMPFQIPTPAWVDQAACAGIADPDVFFPGSDKRTYQRQVEDAQAICFSCPVQDKCLELALEDPSLHGIWAGTTERDRSRIRTSRARSIA